METSTRTLHINSSTQLQEQKSEDLNDLTISNIQVAKLLPIIQAKSFSSVKAHDSLSVDLLNSKDFWRHLFAAMTENGQIAFHLKMETDLAQVMPLLKMNGFGSIEIVESSGYKLLEAKKPTFKAGGTLLKKKNKPAEAKPEANPWDNLDENKPAEMLNEDQLMTEADKDGSIAKTFAGSGDRIMAGKPCDNCTCGKKELFEEAGGIEKLETGQVESSCGKCYLGDAFRCASCPFLGKPAFEAGDKLKLQNADVAQVKTETEKVAVKEGSTKVVLDL